MDSTQPPTDLQKITAGQIRAARALLGWSRDDAARQCGVGSATLARVERGERAPHRSTIDDIVAGFEARGVRFVSVEGAIGVLIAEGR